MGKNSTIPGHDKLSRPTYTVMVNGTDVTASMGVVSVMVNKSVNRIPVAEVVLYDGSASKQNFELSEGEDFLPGSEVIISAGYAKDEEEIFKGIIIKQSIKGRIDTPSTIHLELKDVAIKSTINRKNKYFFDKTDSDIITEALGEFAGTVESTDVTYKEMVQYYATDWDFAASRAEANGKLMIVEDGLVNIAAPDFTVPGNAINFFYGGNIVEIEAGMNAFSQVTSVTAKDWDYTAQAPGESQPNTDSLTDEEGNFSSSELADVVGSVDLLLQHPGKLMDAELTAWADSKFLRSKMSKIIGRVRVYGTSKVKPGQMVVLNGLGDRFNGAAFVSSVTNSFSSKTTWYTDVHFGYTDEWFYERYDAIVDKSAAGLLPSVNGLVCGLVTDIDDADGGEFRVRVKIPLISTGEDGVWARIVSADAGAGRGILIRPEVDDEVILGFVNNDPRDPIVLGMLYSSTKAPQTDLTPTSDNDMKGWFTRGEIKLFINDKKDNQSVTIETPGGNKIVIQDKKNENSITITNKVSSSVTNTITMNKDGIKIDSGKDIVVSAPKGKVTVTGQKDVLAESKTGKITVKGTQGAELSSSAQAVVKASIVKIN
jgi:Rhs element Vgr protein